MRKTLSSVLLSTLIAASACLGGDDPLDGENDSFPDGKADGGIDEGSPEARAVLALCNDPSVDFDELDNDARLNARAAGNIIDHRNGPDGVVGTADDNPFDDLAELDGVRFVGSRALERLLEYAIAQGLLQTGLDVSAIFSPQPKADSHAASVVKLIDGAEHSIDIAMYSFSDGDISDALERAVDRDIPVRFIFETANDDKKLMGSDLRNSKSGRLETAGVDVRFVNKIMHHKFIMVDGPRDDLSRAATARLSTGSANWSFNAATFYDENTVFISGSAELALRYQREFNLMWEHARDLVVETSRPHVLSTLKINDDLIASQDDPNLTLHLTSDNFTISNGSTTFRTDKSKMTASDAWVDAIERAESQILIASGHLRLRPVAEALIAKRAANPNMDIRVYLDGQEYIGFSANESQITASEECVANATTESKRFDCLNKSFLFSKLVSDGGVDLRFKYYAFRWHFAYAEQMHHKYMLIDGKELLTGSYNLSINAEHSTFENVMGFSGPDYAGLVNAYIDNFEKVWKRGADDGSLDALRDSVANDPTFAIVFDPMALTWEQVNDLKSLMIDNCPQIFSTEFRTNPTAHKVCTP